MVQLHLAGAVSDGKRDAHVAITHANDAAQHSHLEQGWVVRAMNVGTLMLVARHTRVCVLVCMCVRTCMRLEGCM